MRILVVIISFLIVSRVIAREHADSRSGVDVQVIRPGGARRPTAPLSTRKGRGVMIGEPEVGKKIQSGGRTYVYPYAGFRGFWPEEGGAAGGGSAQSVAKNGTSGGGGAGSAMCLGTSPKTFQCDLTGGGTGTSAKVDVSQPSLYSICVNPARLSAGNINKGAASGTQIPVFAPGGEPSNLPAGGTIGVHGAGGSVTVKRNPENGQSSNQFPLSPNEYYCL